jgi:hypothetical protein
MHAGERNCNIIKPEIRQNASQPKPERKIIEAPGSGDRARASRGRIHEGMTMPLRSVLMGAALCAGVFAFSFGSTHADTGYRVSGPLTHENLSIYFLHGKSAEGAVPLTLEEAMLKNAVRVDETGSVNQLSIENLGSQDVFVQAGDIVKGGKQDRVLSVSFVLPPNSGKMPISAFCVESGRWRARGAEDVTKFASAGSAVPSKKAKLAMRMPAPVAPDGGRQNMNDTSSRQQEVWSTVAQIQDKLSGNVGARVAAPQSASSLQLSLENEKLADMRREYVKTLKAGGENDRDIVGYVFAINGKLNSADVYPSNGLFRKMWGKLLNASVTEAIGDRGGIVAEAPKANEVLAFLGEAEKGKSVSQDIGGRAKIETRDAPAALYMEAARPSGGFVHKNYLMK